MNKRLEDVLAKLKDLPDEQQQEAAGVLMDYLDTRASEVWLSPEQIAEIERRVADDGPYATDEEVRATFDRLTR